MKLWKPVTGRELVGNSSSQSFQNLSLRESGGSVLCSISAVDFASDSKTALNGNPRTRVTRARKNPRRDLHRRVDDDEIPRESLDESLAGGANEEEEGHAERLLAAVPKSQRQVGPLVR